MLNCLAASIAGGERVVSCEEVFELRYAIRLHTCEPLSTFASHSIVTAPVPP